MNGYRGYKTRHGDLSRKRSLPRRADMHRAWTEAEDRCGYRLVRVRGRNLERDWTDGVSMLLARRRADLREHVAQAARCYASRADLQTGTTFYASDQLCAAAGFSRSTRIAVRRELEQAGALALVTPGRKYWYGDQSRSDAAVYLLLLPRFVVRKIAAARRAASARRLTRTPTVSPKGSYLENPKEPGRKSGKPERGPRSARAHPKSRPRAAPSGAVARAAGVLAEVLRHGRGKTITEQGVAYLAGPYAEAGWLAGDYYHALHFRPDGTPHGRGLDDARRLLGVLRYRLAFWIEPDDAAAVRAHKLPWRKARPIPSRSQQAAATTELERARADQLRAEHAAAAAAAVDPRPRVTAIFAQMGWHRPSPASSASRDPRRSRPRPSGPPGARHPAP